MLISNMTGKKSAALKQGWSARTPIYNWMLYRTLDCDMDEDAAIEEIQAVFDMVDANGRPEHYSRNGVPDLKKIAKRIRSGSEVGAYLGWYLWYLWYSCVPIEVRKFHAGAERPTRHAPRRARDQ
jgi:hypothetical protein